MWTFGGGGKHNNFGQLGLGDSDDRGEPVLVKALEGKVNVTVVVCGGYHTLAITDQAQLYTWGRGDFGQLGTGRMSHELVPTHVESLRHRRVVEVAAGDNHSLCLLDGGEMTSFGFGQYGQLGHGSASNESEPKSIAFFTNSHRIVKQIAAGQSHSICLTAEGSVFTWGAGEHGQLGHGQLKSVTLPTEVVALKVRFWTSTMQRVPFPNN